LLKDSFQHPTLILYLSHIVSILLKKKYVHAKQIQRTTLYNIDELFAKHLTQSFYNAFAIITNL